MPGVEEVDVDQIMQEIEAPKPERAMTGEAAPAPEAAPPAAPDPNAWRSNFQWEFESGGKKIAVDSAEKAKTWLQLGYGANQRFQEVKTREAEIIRREQEAQNLQKQYSQYAEVDQFRQQNPDWWKHVWENYQQRHTHGQDPQLAQVVNPLLQRLEATEGYIQRLREMDEQRQSQEQDGALDAEIQSIRKDFPTIDLSAADPESGRSLEWKVLDHAQRNGINSFRAAFRDFFFDKLRDEAKASNLSTIAKGEAQAAKRGVLGVTPVPTKGLKPAGNVRGKSYDALTEEALRELGIN